MGGNKGGMREDETGHKDAFRKFMEIISVSKPRQLHASQSMPMQYFFMINNK